MLFRSVSPVSGKVVSVFPSKHAIGLMSEDGIEVLVHMGLDTVQMKEPAFDVVVSEGDTVAAGQLLANANWEAVKAEGKGTTIVVVFTNVEKYEALEMILLGQQQKATSVGRLKI